MLTCLNWSLLQFQSVPNHIYFTGLSTHVKKRSSGSAESLYHANLHCIFKWLKIIFVKGFLSIRFNRLQSKWQNEDSWIKRRLHQSSVLQYDVVDADVNFSSWVEMLISLLDELSVLLDVHFRLFMSWQRLRNLREAWIDSLKSQICWPVVVGRSDAIEPGRKYKTLWSIDETISFCIFRLFLPFSVSWSVTHYKSLITTSSTAWN